MKTITNNITNEIVINKSRFICLLIKINSNDEVEDILNELKKEHKDATHYCYAYIIDNVKRFNDDGEPGGTAGMPILNVLENKELNNILCVVIRYFGGIKLGAGGLVRAYTKSVTSCLENCELKNITIGKLISLEFNYDDIKKIDILIDENEIVSKKFDQSIYYEILISNDRYEIIREKLNNICNINIIEENKKF